MNTTPFQIASSFIGAHESDGDKDNPLILAMIATCSSMPEIHDEIAWCSAFVNFIHKICGLPRTHSLAAKSWLNFGQSVPLISSPISSELTTKFNDIIILNRGPNPALGHVGFFAGSTSDKIVILGGNQSNSVCVQSFDINLVAGIRRFV